MKIGPTRLLVLHGSLDFHGKVRGLVGRDFHYVPMAGWSDLAGQISDSTAATLAIVDPYFGNGGVRLADEIRTLLMDFPSLSVAAAFTLSADRVGDLKTLGRWGVSEIVSVGHDDEPGALRQRFRRMRGQKLRQLIFPILPEETSGRARAILDAAAEVVVVGGTGGDLARSLDLSRRTLLRWTQDAGLPPVRKLLPWVRILLAAELLDDPGRTVLQAARAAGYGSDSGLRRVTVKYLGLAPTLMRPRGAFAAAAKPFKAALLSTHPGAKHDEGGRQ